jgi:uncharacterized protein DUF4198
MSSAPGTARLQPGSSLLLLSFFLLLAPPLAAHDHWITPSSFHPAVGERVELRLCVGHPSAFEEQLRDPRRSVRFELLAPSATKPVPGLDGRSPAGFFAPREAGLHVLAYQSNHAFVELEPAKYAEYLRVEGLDDIQAERERRGELERPGRDSYLRCDKALLRVGDAPAGSDRRLGLPLELVSASDLGAWTSGVPLELDLLLDGRPLAGRQVKLMRLTAPHTILLARTGADGRARFTPDAGAWVASTVHQRRATPEQALEGDWEGLWASLAFELPPDHTAR